MSQAIVALCRTFYWFPAGLPKFKSAKKGFYTIHIPVLGGFSGTSRGRADKPPDDAHPGRIRLRLGAASSQGFRKAAANPECASEPLGDSSANDARFLSPNKVNHDF